MVAIDISLDDGDDDDEEEEEDIYMYPADIVKSEKILIFWKRVK